MNSRIFLVAASILALASLPAAAKIAIFTPETEQTATVMAIVANTDGGFSGYTDDAGVHHYDSTGRLIGSEVLPFDFLETHGEIWSFPPRLSALTLGAGHHLITDPQPLEGYWWEPRSELVNPEPDCAVTRLVSGLKVTRLWHGSKIRMSTRQADSEGGIWIHADDGRVFRFGSDCRAIAVAKFPVYLYGLHADPTSRSVLALTSELELIKLSPDGIEWRRRLPEASDWQRSFARLIVMFTGEVVVAYTSQAPGNSSYPDRIVAFSPQGTLLWNEEGSHDHRGLYATRDGFVQVESYELIARSRNGKVVSSYTHSDGALWASGASVSGTHIWARYETYHAEANSQIVVFNPSTGHVQTRNIDLGQVADVAGLTDGRVVVYKRSDATHGEPATPSFHLATASTSFAGVPVPVSTLRQGMNVSAADALGAALIVQEESYWNLFVTDASLRQLWVRRIPDTETSHNTQKMQIALGSDRICVLTEIRKSAPSSEGLIILQCFRRSDGRDAHQEIVWPGQSPYLEPVIAGPTDVVFFGPGDRKPILRYLITGTGSVNVGQPPFSELSPLALPFCPCDAIEFDDGSRALLWRAADELLFFPVGSNGNYVSHWLDRSVARLPMQHFAQGHGRLGVLASSNSYLKNEALVTFYTSSGTWLGSATLESDQLLRGQIGLLTATREGWIAVMATPEIMHVWHIPKDADLHQHGSIRPQPLKPVSARLRIETPINEWEPSPWTGRSVLDFDGKHLVLASYQTTVTSVYRLDPETLEIVSSSSLRFRPRVRHGYGPEFNRAADGSLYLAGEAPGVRGYQPAIWKLDSVNPVIQPDFSLHSLNGAWYDPSVSGQGFFLDYIEAANVLFGAWFTFSTESTHQPSGLQWYTLSANPTPGTGKISGDIYLNRDGRFEQGPVTQAERVGRFKLWPAGQDRLQIAIYFDEPHHSGLQLGHRLERVLPVDSSNGIRHWFDPVIAGQGLLMAQPLDSPGPFFAGWFAYDPAFRNEGPYAQHWFTALGGEKDQHGYSVATIYRTVGGSLGTAVTHNTNAVGQLRLKLLACDRLQFEYNFDNADLAGSFAGLAGERILRPINGCVVH